MSHRNFNVYRRAFTLVELLVVVAIISILIGLLLPVVTSVLKRGRLAACTSNQGQIYKLILAAAGEARAFPDGTGMQWNHFFKLPGFTNTVREPKVLECPADRGVSSWPAASGGCFVESLTDPQASYVYAAADVAPAGVGKISGVRLSQLGMPSRKVVVFEPVLHSGNPMSKPQNRWHDAKGNHSVISFADGHTALVLTNHTTISENNTYH
ncbi:MAG: prepilin-type N-terminal cleavage/methylation domain-containing protein [Kiritimatiellaeota bacterium]|nr:prepilin-type N-terminal cleavage/methylation domain-containing protein [Kiritimatiellota bacterium]